MEKKNQETLSEAITKKTANGFLETFKTNWLPIVLIFLSAILIYSNTIKHEYALDDQMVVYDNKFVTAGTDSLLKIMTTDAFEGFFGKRGGLLISGGRYRPFTYITFALEWELFGRNPMVSHIINMISYACLCVLIYFFLIWLFPVRQDPNTSRTSLLRSLPFLATILYTLHPIHTEVVANIKGRDEIYGFLFSIAALIYFFQVFKKRWNDYFAVFLLFFLAVLSKENTITFLAIFFLVAIFKNKDVLSLEFLKPFAAILASTALYLFLRTHSTRSGLTAHTEEILNNPFVRASGSEKWGTILFSYLEYLKILIFPSTLTHDYYFNQIPYRKLSDPWVLLALLGILALVVLLIKYWKKKNEIVFAIVFFVVTFSIVSNVFFTVGIIMNERFVFVSSLGFTIILAALLIQRVRNDILFSAIVVVICSLYSFKTVKRNHAWKDNYTLFSTDFYNSPNSAKVSMSFGGSLLERATDILKSDSNLAKKLMDSSIKVLAHSLTIYPENSQAWLLYGNAIYSRTRDENQALSIYRNCLLFRPGHFDALYNIGFLNYNSQRLDSAEKYLAMALQANPEHIETRDLLGKIYAKTGRTQEAIQLTGQAPQSLGQLSLEAMKGGNYSEALNLANQVLNQNPNDAQANYAIGICYSKHMNRLAEGIPYLEKAVKLDTTNGVWLEDLAVAYGMSGRVSQTIPLLERVIQLRPNDPAGYRNLATTYNLLGDSKKAKYYNDLANSKSQP